MTAQLPTVNCVKAGFQRDIDTDTCLCLESTFPGLGAEGQ